MSWIYEQRTGRLHAPGGKIFRSTGYSGNFLNQNYGPHQGLRDHGPIPTGLYKIGWPRHNDQHGPYTMALEPIGHSAFGRDCLLIHGDNKKSPGNASTGCIILNWEQRLAIAISPDRYLKVR